MDADAPDPVKLISPDVLAKGRELALAAAKIECEKYSAYPEQQAAIIEAYVAGFLDTYARAALRERARIAAIVQSPEAQGREDDARRLALETSLQPVEAAFILAAPEGASPLVRPAAGTRDDQVARLTLSAGMTGRA